MKECNVILIDDRAGFHKSATITNMLKRASENHQLRINLFPFNPKAEQFVNEDGDIMEDRIIDELKSPNFLKQSIQLIACDYDFGGDKINGFEVIRMLRKKLDIKKRIILYSSNIENVIEKILDGTKPEIIQRIVDLVNSHISAFCSRDSHLEEEMIKNLKAESVFSTDKALEKEMYKYRNFKFKTTYAKFDNKTLGEVAEYISNKEHEGELLKQELVEQLIAYMIMMEHE